MYDRDALRPTELITDKWHRRGFNQFKTFVTELHVSKLFANCNTPYNFLGLGWGERGTVTYSGNRAWEGTEQEKPEKKARFTGDSFLSL